MKSEKLDQFYRQQWHERWPELKSALLKDSKYFARFNSFAEVVQLEPQHQFGLELDEALSPEVDKNGLLQFYPMDLASLYPVLALDLNEKQKVLDMCAAPGGKALFLIEQHFEAGGSITLNEYSKARLGRLKKVLTQYIPEHIIKSINVKNYDASKWGLYEKDSYDRLLLDAPCSGERHILLDENVLD